jgi:hypothetical protein
MTKPKTVKGLAIIEHERAMERKKQAKRVMPLIGTLLDRWDDLPGDVKSDPELEKFSRIIQKIGSAITLDE